jgi:hypothetical protein
VFSIGGRILLAIACRLHVFNGVREAEIHTAEPLLSGTSSFEVEIATENLKSINHQVLIKYRQN